METGLDWFADAREFSRITSDALTPTEFLELELQAYPSPFHLPVNVRIQPRELPGIYRVQNSYHGHSEFEYFMDGVQRTILWKYYDFNDYRIPVFLHFSGAVIMERKRPFEFRHHLSLYRSKVLVPNFIHEMWCDEESVVDTGAGNCWDLNEIKAKAMIKSRALRQEIELDLVNRFLAEKRNGLIIKDGSIFKATSAANVVGIIKSHNTLYLQPNHPRIQQLVWAMAEFHRSMAFAMEMAENGSVSHRVNSFYLRMHEPRSPEMGLLRVEYNGEQAPDDLSSWIIAEGRVIAPTARWDTQIYPVQICENYLRTQLPSPQYLRAVLPAV
ncbi:MAG: hypothetical protein ACE5G7_06620 [Candidatus Hydrothermarchaeaceae archaeon]